MANIGLIKKAQIGVLNDFTKMTILNGRKNLWEEHFEKKDCNHWCWSCGIKCRI